MMLTIDNHRAGGRELPPAGFHLRRGAGILFQPTGGPPLSITHFGETMRISYLMPKRPEPRPGRRPPGGPAQFDLVGRQDELGLLRTAVEAAIAGRGGLVLITGDPGIGKTAVASKAAEHAVSLRAQVLWASCWEGEGMPGFWPWAQVVRLLLSQASTAAARRIGTKAPLMTRLLFERTAPLLESGAAGHQAEGVRFHLFDELASTLLDQAASRPLVVVLDDLQWADSASILLLDFLARRLHASHLLVIGTCRDVEVSAGDPAARLLSGAGNTVLPLSPLSEDDVLHLMAAVLRRHPGLALAEVVHRRTGGNPFLIDQVTRLLHANAGREQPVEPGAIPVGVHESVEQLHLERRWCHRDAHHG
jgi:predicted ATPase